MAYVLRGKGAQGEGDTWWSKLTKEEREELNKTRSGRRAGQKVRKLARYGDLRRLLTFTNGAEGEGWHTLRQALRDVRRWYRQEGRDLLGDTGFVAIAERGKVGGRVHVHAAIRAGHWLDYSAIIRSWSAFMEAQGHRSSTGIHRFHAGDEQGKGYKGFRSARTCAAYLSKYLAKGFAEEERVQQERRYFAESLTVPEPHRVAGFRLSEVPEVVRASLAGATLTPFTDGEGNLSGYWFDADPPPRV